MSRRRKPIPELQDLKYRHFTCKESGKVAYPTRSEAQKYKKKTEQMHDTRFAIYKCDVCDAFHLTKLKNGIRHRNKRND